MTLKLEVGKYYKQRYGYVTQVVRYNELKNKYYYLSNDVGECPVLEDGRIKNVETIYDLIEEVNADGTPIMKKPKIVTLCGSTKFYDEFQKANYEFTMKGYIVLSVGFYPHAQKEMHHSEDVGCTPEQKKELDELHKCKIDISDEVYVLNVGGYIGESIKSEIEHAKQKGIPISYLEEPLEIKVGKKYICNDPGRVGTVLAQMKDGKFIVYWNDETFGRVSGNGVYTYPFSSAYSLKKEIE